MILWVRFGANVPEEEWHYGTEPPGDMPFNVVEGGFGLPPPGYVEMTLAEYLALPAFDPETEIGQDVTHYVTTITGIALTQQEREMAVDVKSLTDNGTRVFYLNLNEFVVSISGDFGGGSVALLASGFDSGDLGMTTQQFADDDSGDVWEPLADNGNPIVLTEPTIDGIRGDIEIRSLAVRLTGATEPNIRIVVETKQHA